MRLQMNKWTHQMNLSKTAYWLNVYYHFVLLIIIVLICQYIRSKTVEKKTNFQMTSSKKQSECTVCQNCCFNCDDLFVKMCAVWPKNNRIFRIHKVIIIF